MSGNDVGQRRVVIIGAGPAGLTAAYRLDAEGIESVLLEKDSIVGGISRTVKYNDYLFDIGGHRFFTKVSAVEKLWKDVLGEDLLRRKRLSRIYYNGKFYDYPLKPANALLGLGIWNSFLLFSSYIYAQLFPTRDEKTFEDWVSNRFGRRLYRTFFKTYTEKVWGMPCAAISADWAAQRIKDLSLVTALKASLLPAGNQDNARVVKTLIDSFLYPKRGPGMIWERIAERVARGHCELKLNHEVTRVCWAGDRVRAVETASGGSTETIAGTDFVSSMPMREFIDKLDPPPPPEFLEAASRLKYRDFLTVAIIVDRRGMFPDNWIYIHDPSVKVGRIQNFNNWSPYMVPDPSKTCLGLEYFCFEDDDLWSLPDDRLISLATQDLVVLRLIQPEEVIDGKVVRMPKAYPVYDENYAQALRCLRRFLSKLENLQLIGRNGMHKYNNQDHSMLTAMLAVENILGTDHDVWEVNVDQDYHEELATQPDRRAKDFATVRTTQPLVPMPIAQDEATEELLIRAFARTDKLALASAVGIVFGTYMLLATLYLAIQDNRTVSAAAELLGQYFFGYSVSYQGALVGWSYGFFWGFLLGWLIAYLRNAMLGLYVSHIKKRAESDPLRDLLLYI